MMLQTQVTLISLALTALATSFLAVIAWVQIYALRRESAEERRPFVFVEVEKAHTSDGKEALYISFPNCGRMPAKNVQATIRANPWKAIGDRTLAFERPQGILMLPPGSTMTYFVGVARGNLLASYNSELVTEMTVTYFSARSKTPHTDVFQLSLLDTYGARRQAP